MIKKFIQMCKYYNNKIDLKAILVFSWLVLLIVLIMSASVQGISQDDCKDLCESLGLVAQDYAPAHACFCCNHTIIIVNNQKFIESNNDCKLYIKYGNRK